MKMRFVCAAAVAVMLAACSTPKKESGGAAPAAAPPAPAAPAAPKGPAPDSIEYFNSVVGNSINFALDKYDLSPQAQSVLKGQATWLNQYPARTVAVEGHCDERGTREYNLGLGDRRANSVKQFLVAQGVNAGRVKVISYGKERPLCVSSDEACWGKNRRGTSVVQ